MQTVIKIRRWRWPISFFAIALVLTVGSYFVSYSVLRQAELTRASDRASFYRTILVKALDRYRYLPFILAKNPIVVAAAQGQNRDPLNARFAEFAEQSDVDVIYLMDAFGMTVASSNFADPLTFLGHNYAFRPYFQTALKGQSAEFFAIGATSLKPGYFIAEPVRNRAGIVVGVITIKIDMKSLTDTWNQGGEQVFVSNKDGIIVLSSSQDWRYKTIRPLSEGQRALIAVQRQFGAEPLNELAWEEAGPDLRKIMGERHFYVPLDVAKNNWFLHFLSPEAPVRRGAAFTSVVLAVLVSLALAWAFFVRSERIRAALHDSQIDRRKLRRANINLALEVQERHAAEQRLARAQKELAQTSRLAALGHLSASVTHELGQPISAMRNYLAAAEIDPTTEDLPKLIAALTGIAQRMENTTQQLRFFAKPGNAAFEKIDVKSIIDGALGLLNVQLAKESITLTTKIKRGRYHVRGNQLRLEQVLINVLRNACNALADTPDPTINVRVRAQADYIRISIEDNGNGLEGIESQKLFEPFFTTRASGDGMGLGLAISSAIVKEHGGQISAKTMAKGGARFLIELPLWQDE